QVRNVEAVVKQRQAQLDQAKVDLERTAIRAPVNGVVISRNVDAGQTVAASLQAPTLFVIAQNLAEMQVDTSIDEAEVGRVRVGQDATFTVDSFAGRNFSGKVMQVRKAPQVVQNVVSYIAVISAPNPDLALVPGMTANVRIVVDSRDSALKIPSAALRFRPPGAGEATSSAGAAPKGQAGGGGGAQAAALRERLTKELNLTEEQQAKLEAIQQEIRASIAALPAGNPDERRRQAQKVRAESRVRIAAMLTDEQRVRYEEIAAEGRAATRGRVWVLDEAGKPNAVNVRLGLSDGSFSELIGGSLSEGTQLIVGTAGPAGSRPATKAGGVPGLF
ncbi:MAG: efflux RND transporter periplasmic adaptor subunit, partial [Betaproteobacteria bacterium]|nr:efflux RND transporter periplasmic adaptor subunit [Betaproteobacteria bacterium]